MYETVLEFCPRFPNILVQICFDVCNDLLTK